MPVKHLRIVALIEDTSARADLLREHGLSFYVQADDTTGLFDTGSTEIFATNAVRLGVKLTGLSWVALSHCHYDHTGGLRAVLKINPSLKVYLHPDALLQKYIKKNNANVIGGMNMTADEIKNAGGILQYTETPFQVTPDVFVTGAVPRVTDFEDASNVFLVNRNGNIVPDNFPDDQSLVIRTARGLVILLGCAHAGVVNILNYAIKISGCEIIYAVIGGMHLGAASDERIQKTISALKTFNVKKIGIGHCTGEQATLTFQKEFGKCCFLCSTGTVFELTS